MKILAHAHSDWSHDGRLTLADWPDVARSVGADVVWLTEHEESGWTTERYAEYARACRVASTPAVQLVPGIEFLQDGQHVLCYGLREWPARPGSAADLASQVKAQERFLCLAHPGKYRWRPAQGLHDVVEAVEVWNSKWLYDGSMGPHPAALTLSRGRLPLVGQDVHARKHLSGLLIEVSGTDPIAEVRKGHYGVVSGTRHWTPDELQQARLKPFVQSLRTPALRAALVVHRWLRQTGVIPKRPADARTGEVPS